MERSDRASYASWLIDVIGYRRRIAALVRDRRAVPDICRAALAEQDEDRWIVLQDLAWHDWREVLAAAADMLHNADPAVRILAADILSQIRWGFGLRGEVEEGGIEQHLPSGVVRRMRRMAARWQAAEAIITDAVMALLQDRLSVEENPEVLAAVIQAISPCPYMSQSLRERLLVLRQHPASIVRKAVAPVLFCCFHMPDDAGILVEMTGDEDPEVRELMEELLEMATYSVTPEPRIPDPEPRKDAP